jgi:hypothetical protein
MLFNEANIPSVKGKISLASQSLAIGSAIARNFASNGIEASTANSRGQETL